MTDGMTTFLTILIFTLATAAAAEISIWGPERRARQEIGNRLRGLRVSAGPRTGSLLRQQPLGVHRLEITKTLQAMIDQARQVFDIADRVVEIAEKYERRPAQIALAWLLSKPGITSPVVGVSKIEQLDQLVAATEIELAPQDVAYLEELYRPVDNLLSLGAS